MPEGALVSRSVSRIPRTGSTVGHGPPSGRLWQRMASPHFLPRIVARDARGVCVLGMAEEFRPLGVAVNALWPRSVIHTSALTMLHGTIRPEGCRTLAIVADAAYAVVKRDSRQCTGNFCIDEDVLAEEGITDLWPYALAPKGRPYPDLFVD